MKIESEKLIEKIDRSLDAISIGTTLFSDGYRTAMSQVKDMILMEVQLEQYNQEWQKAAEETNHNNHE